MTFFSGAGVLCGLFTLIYTDTESFHLSFVVTEIFTVPAEIPVTSPELDTVAIFVLSDFHVNVFERPDGCTDTLN